MFETTNRPSTVGFKIVVAVALIAAGLAAWKFTSPVGTTAKEDPEHWRKVEVEARELAKAALDVRMYERLKDGASARYADVEYFRQSHDLGDGTPFPGGVYVMCGKVNAKNSFGGYTGYKRFSASIFLSLVENRIMDELTNITFEGDTNWQNRIRDDCRNRIENLPKQD